MSIEEKIEIVEEKYVALGLLKFSGVNPIDITLSIADFLLQLINVYNKQNDTYQADAVKEDFDNLRYTDPKDKHRSIKDLFRICKYYYPETNLLEVTKTLFDLHKSGKVYSLWCHNIQQVTFFPNGARGYGNQDYKHLSLSVDGISEITVKEYYDNFIK